MAVEWKEGRGPGSTQPGLWGWEVTRRRLHSGCAERGLSAGTGEPEPARGEGGGLSRRPRCLERV